jgi:hypothetical protein
MGLAVEPRPRRPRPPPQQRPSHHPPTAVPSQALVSRCPRAPRGRPTGAKQKSPSLRLPRSGQPPEPHASANSSNLRPGPRAANHPRPLIKKPSRYRAYLRSTVTSQSGTGSSLWDWLADLGSSLRSVGIFVCEMVVHLIPPVLRASPDQTPSKLPRSRSTAVWITDRPRALAFFAEPAVRRQGTERAICSSKS